jgi:beta-glucosidase
MITSPLENRVEKLLAAMTLEEKCSQLNYRNPGIPRLGIPSYVWWNEGLHGLARSGTATCFPQPIAMAATFSEELVGKMAGVTALEARTRFFHASRRGDRDAYKGLTIWAPNVNIFRDPRWGRGHETYGECPFLTSRLAVAFVRELQKNKGGGTCVAATPKHFAVHSGPEAVRLQFNATVGEQDLWETYLPAFRACIEEAGALSIMSAYNAINGIPCSVNRRFLVEILREKWGFKGAVVTDAGAGAALVAEHKYSANAAEAVAKEIMNGVDVLSDEEDIALAAVSAGLLQEADVDRAVRNQLRVKAKLGLLDSSESLPIELIDSPGHQKWALQAARKSIVLLQNPGRILPLDPAAISTIAVIGPNAADRQVLLGNYHGTPSRTVTALEGIQDFCGNRARVLYALGCPVAAGRVEHVALVGDRMAEALAIAECADVVILCVGLNPSIEGEAGDAFNSEAGGDKRDLELPGLQRRLIDEVAGLGKPFVLVNVSGSSVILPTHYGCPILQCFYPGALGGQALAEVIFGKVNPSGQLPVTFYSAESGLPSFDDYSMENRTYRFHHGPVQFPFGHGLSYTSFSHKIEGFSPGRNRGGTAKIRVMVENTGERAGEEVVQIYLSRQAMPFRTPKRQLVGFKRIALKPGQHRLVVVPIPARSVSHAVDERGHEVEVGGRVVFTTNQDNAGFEYDLS